MFPGAPWNHFGESARCYRNHFHNKTKPIWPFDCSTSNAGNISRYHLGNQSLMGSLVSCKSEGDLRWKMLRITAVIDWLKKHMTSSRSASVYYAIPVLISKNALKPDVPRYGIWTNTTLRSSMCQWIQDSSQISRSHSASDLVGINGLLSSVRTWWQTLG